MRKGNHIYTSDAESADSLYEGVKIPESFGLVSAFSFIIQLACSSELTDKFWETARPALSYLNTTLGLSDIQIVFLAVLLEDGDPMTWLKIGEVLGVRRLEVLVYAPEMEELVQKGWVLKTKVKEFRSVREGFKLENGVESCITQEKVFIPENFSHLTLQEFLDRVTDHIHESVSQFNYEIEEEDFFWYRRIINSNPQLELCRRLNELGNEYDRVKDR